MRNRSRAAGAPVPVLIALVALAAGCVGEPEVDERWTRVDIGDAQPALSTPVAPGSSVTVMVHGSVTYRRMFSGFFVAEARYSSTLTPDVVRFGEVREDDFVGTAADVDRVLSESVSAGRSAQAVVGFPQLIQDVDFEVDVSVPAAMANGEGGLFFVLYLADGDEMELPSGADSLVLTALPAVENEMLHDGEVIVVNSSPRAVIFSLVSCPALGVTAAATLLFLLTPSASTAEDSPWLSASPVVGVQLLDPHLRDFGWDVSAQMVLGAEVQGGWRRLRLGLRGWRSRTQQGVGIEGQSPLRVGLSAVELSSSLRLATVAHVELDAGAAVGRLHAGYDPTRLEIPGNGGEPLVIEFSSLDSWTVGLGAGLRRPLSERVALALQVDRWWFDLDTAHRAGSQIDLSRERFGQWAFRLHFDWLWRVP